MARSFNGTDGIAQGTTALPTTGAVSLWLYPTWVYNDGANHSIFNLNSGGSYFDILKNSNSYIYCGWYTGVEYRVTVQPTTLNQNAWNHLFLSWVNGGDTKFYINGTQSGSTVTSTGTWNTAGATRLLGAFPSFGTVDGRLAEFAIWSAVPSAGDLASLAAGVSPSCVLPSSLTDYLPLIGRTSPEPNLRGGTAGTLTGTAQADHPRVYYPGRRRTVFVPGAGGGTVVSGYGTAAGVNLTTAESQARFATFGAAGGSNSGVGEGRSRHQSAGTAAGTASVVGVSAARVEAVGAAAGSNVSTGVGRIRKAGSGVAAGTNSATGASQARAALIGAAAGTNDTDAVSRALWEASGSADGTNTATGYIIDGNAPPTWMRNLQILKKGVS